MAKKKNKSVVKKNVSVKEKNFFETIIPSDKKFIMNMVIFLVVGLILGSLITFAAFSNNVVEENGLVEKSDVDIVKLSQKVEDYLNENLVVDSSVNAVIVGVEEIEKGFFEVYFEIFENEIFVGDGVVYSTEKNLVLGQLFDLDVPLDFLDDFGQDQQNVEPPIETRSLTEEEMQEIISFNECLAEKGLVVYGANWCGFTTNLVENLGGYSLVTPFYIECTQEEKLCSEENITGFPTIKLNGEKINPNRTFEGFATVTGCKAPDFSSRVEAQAYTGGC